MRRAAALAALLPLVLLGACQSGAELTGLAAGGAAGVVTASPAVGYAVGIGTAVAANEFFNWIGRTREHAAQEAIAGAAAPLAVGGAAPWRIDHVIPVGDEHGEVRLVRAMTTPLAECREILFSVEEPPAAAAWYATSICRAASGWHWALAEPAVERWGFLQQALP
jgi:hypothetical protein